MKNTMKKLLSLVLVAMLLVCAVPFLAAATEASVEKLNVKVYVDGVYNTDKQIDVKPGESLTLTKELAETMIKSDKEFVKWTNMKDVETTGPISYDNLKKANADGYRPIGADEGILVVFDIEAMKNGVARVHMLDGRVEHCLLLEFFTEKGIGTAILKEPLF